MTTSSVEHCACCGDATSIPERIDLTVPLPDGVSRTSETDPNAAFLRVRDGRSFVRCRLPVALTGGVTLTYLTWMGITETDLVLASAAWREQSWAGLVLHGTLANELRPWISSLRGAEITAEVLSIEEPLTITDSVDPALRRVMTEVWDRDVVLNWFPDPLPVAVRVRVGEHWSLERGAGMAAGLNGEGGWRFGRADRAVFAEVLTDPAARAPEDFLRDLLADAPDVPGEQTLVIPDAGGITHAFWLETDVGGVRQHDLYAHVVRRGTALSLGVFHSIEEDHRWALHVLRSVLHHA